jgi:hypothetical protein
MPEVAAFGVYSNHESQSEMAATHYPLPYHRRFLPFPDRCKLLLRKRRAAYVLQRIQALKLDNSSIEELKRLGSEHGLRYEASIYCANTPCAYMVSPKLQETFMSRKGR